MNSDTTVKIETTLVLSEEEADWLNKVMQNYTYSQKEGYVQEPSYDKDMREKFFEATKSPSVSTGI